MDIGLRAVKSGVTTDELDRIVHEATIERNAYPSPLGYKGFPKSSCTYVSSITGVLLTSCCSSVNEVICHGVPDSRELESGDIVNLDVSVYFDGVHSDVNAMAAVGEIDAASKAYASAY